MSGNKKKKSKVEEKFSEFMDKWVLQLEELVRQMVIQRRSGSDDQVEVEGVIGRVTSHVKAFYTAKWAAAREDVVAFYEAPWASPLEASLMWLTGWKPSSVFRLLDSASIAAYPQLRQLKSRVRSDEDRLEREIERHHVGVAARRVLELSRHPEGGPVVVSSMLGVLERLMKAADCVRLKALKGVLDCLSPSPSLCLDFLAAVSMLHLHLRHLQLPTNTNTTISNGNVNGLALPISTATSSSSILT